jgi:hypothetical protein
LINILLINDIEPGERKRERERSRRDSKRVESKRKFLEETRDTLCVCVGERASKLEGT